MYKNYTTWCKYGEKSIEFKSELPKRTYLLLKLKNFATTHKFFFKSLKRSKKCV